MGMDERVTSRTGQKGIQSFVLREGRLTKLQERAIRMYGDTYAVPFVSEQKNPGEFFGSSNPVVIEIGFGMGITTAEIARQQPDTNYLGIEVFRSGVGRLLHEIAEQKLENIRIIRFDAVEVLQKMIPDRTVSGFHIFFPDPWQKKRHHKRRLIQQPFLQLLCSKLTQDGYIYLVTDWEPYARWMVEEIGKCENLLIQDREESGFSRPRPWRPKTKFEQKGLDRDHRIFELYLTLSR